MNHFEASWTIEKYSLLLDSKRKDPLMVERSGGAELVMKLDLRCKIISIYHSDNKLEEFCISPLTYAHDIIKKDGRVLFCLKNQIDGQITGKFRIRFERTEHIQDFIECISNYLKVQTYEEFNLKNNIAKQDLPLVSNAKHSPPSLSSGDLSVQPCSSISAQQTAMSQSFVTSWALKKYSRLLDGRNDPLTIEKSGGDELMMKLDHRCKIISVYYNAKKLLEKFSVSPLTFEHDIIKKDDRMLFILKSQEDGQITGKFRLRFERSKYSQNFHECISKYLKVQTYEEFAWA